MTLSNKLHAYARLVRLDKPIGSLLLMWPTLWALWLASAGRPDPMLVVIFMVGTVLMRSAGCAVNDWADRDFDGHVERTAKRPIVSGEVSPKEAIVVAVVLALMALLIALPLPTLSLLMTIPAAILAGTYPFFKRFFAIPQAYLGIAFGFGIPMAYAAIVGEVPAIAWWLLVANVLWTIAYDTEYAMVDRNDDIRIGIKTSALTFGRFDVAIIMLCYAIALAILVAVGMVHHLGMIYYGGLVVAGLIAVYHYFLIRTRERAKCFKAFLHNNWFGLAVFVGILGQLM
ncbi:4-hydroxybenzoate octaprenyltransferase [Leeia sp. TBRC 13508]|uniref:4-hydroxybenzoate octaprenyltransferase n=1 Tax=Leeia speluncae TaxID=2884804 RepID=A0ABS8D5N1_9NEIS|nr:4-hydroxybenzoate octaprenyltransferase [Leeia speluncae]MCB6183281.1 4-hydroxybenzoate octaprenyltransferase [Leeia speluncae]